MKINCHKFLLALAKSEMTSTELTVKSNVGRNTISKVMNSDTDVRPLIAGKLAKALGVDVEDIAVFDNKEQ